jgi:hypothetical protein
MKELKPEELMTEEQNIAHVYNQSDASNINPPLPNTIFTTTFIRRCLLFPFLFFISMNFIRSHFFLSFILFSTGKRIR